MKILSIFYPPNVSCRSGTRSRNFKFRVFDNTIHTTSGLTTYLVDVVLEYKALLINGHKHLVIICTVMFDVCPALVYSP